MNASYDLDTSGSKLFFLVRSCSISGHTPLNCEVDDKICFVVVLTEGARLPRKLVQAVKLLMCSERARFESVPGNRLP